MINKDKNHEAYYRHLNDIRFMTLFAILAVLFSIVLLMHQKSKYTQADLLEVRDIIMYDMQPSVQDIERYDLSGDQQISSLDYILIKEEMGLIDEE